MRAVDGKQNLQFHWPKICKMPELINRGNAFKNSLKIHEENTKKNHKRVASLYVDKDFPSFT